MHNNFFFLRQLSKTLNGQLLGFTVVSCFTQNKDELVLEFNNSEKSFFFKASLQSGFCCLSFPERFSRAKKNSVDLFPSVILKKITGTRQYENERAFSLLLESNLTLLFKMHGNRANVVLLGSQRPVEIFRNHLKADLDLDPGKLDRGIDWSEEFFTAHQDTLKESYFTFGKEVWSYLQEQGFDQMDISNRWNLFSITLEKLRHPEFYILKKKEKLIFSLLPSADIIDQFPAPLEAITRFYTTHQKASGFDSVKSTALRNLTSQLSAGKSFVEKNRLKLKELNEDSHYQQWADLIMANLNHIKLGMEKVVLENFYDQNKPIEIKLRKDLNAQTNAEVFYRKAKNRQIEIQKLNESITSKEEELKRVTLKLAAVEKEQDAAGLDKTMGADTAIQHRKDIKKSLPYHEFEFKGFKIWVGKDAKSNDALTLKHSFKEDLWLHAKDVAGSHVLIKHQAGKNFPRDVIERAAELAAYNSKRKTDSLCPVTVTPKKFVRKRKGDPAGAVIVEREDVILVKPGLV